MKSTNGTTLYVEDDAYLKPLKKRYCGNRLSKTSYIIMMIFIVLLAIFLICGLSLYFAVIPTMIRSNFGKLGDPKDGADPLRFSKLNINGFNDTGFHLDVAATLPPLVPWLPASMKLLDPVFYIGSRSGKYVQLKVPDMDIKLNQPYALDMGIDIAFVDNEGLAEFIKQVSNGPDKPDLIISSDLIVEILGSVWYRGLSVEKVVSMKPKETTTRSSSNYNGTIPEALVSANPNALIREKYPENKRIEMGSNLPDVVWETFDVKMTDEGMNLNFSFEIENPTIATLDIPEISFGVGVSDSELVRVSLSPITLDHGINNMKFDIGVTFDKIGEDAGESIGDLLKGSGLNLHGPIVLKGASFAEKVSSSLKMDVSASNTTSSSSLPELPDSSEILEKSQISVNVDGAIINIPLSAVLPRLLPLPPKIEFPASIEFGIFGTSEKAIDVIINPVTIETTEESIRVQTLINIIPVNSVEAANSLSEAVNPLVALSPSDSQIGIGNIKFKVENRVLKWSEELMKSEKIDIPIQAVCLECQITSSKEASETSSSIQPEGIKIMQLLDTSGFGIEALINAPKTENMKVGANLGYFGLDLKLERKDFITFELPYGISVGSDIPKIDFTSRIVLSREPSMSSNFQSLLNSMTDGAQSTIVGVTGLTLGNSKENSIQTFSKIVVELNSKILHGQKLPALGGESKSTKPLATLTNAEVELKSPNDLRIAIGASLEDVPLSLSIGSLNFNTKLDDESLASVGLGPLSISPQDPFVSLSVGLAIVSGNNILSEKVARLVKKFVNSESSAEMALVVSGIVLAPPGVSQGPAVIDQFKDFTIKIDLPQKGSEPSGTLLDTTAFKKEIGLEKLNLNSEGIVFETLPKSTLALSAKLQYDNKSPVRLLLPYLKAEIAVQDVSLLEQTIMDIDLTNGKSSMSPKAYMYFQQDDVSIQDHVARLVANIKEKNCIDSKLSVKGIYFGSSESERNDILSKVDLDISKLIGEVNFPEIGIPDLDQQSGGKKMEISRAEVKASPGKTVSVDASFSTSIDKAIAMNIGTIGAGVLVNNSPLVIASIRGINANFGSDTVALDLGADFTFNEDDQTPKEVASIAKAVQNGQTLGSSIQGNQFSIGYSMEDKINTFSKVRIVIPIDSVLKKLKESNTGDSSFNSSDLDIKPKKLDISFQTGSTITASALAIAKLPYNANVSLPYFDAKLSVDNTNALHSTLKDATFSSEKIFAEVRLAFQDSEELEDKLGEISNAIINEEETGKKAGVHGITFGFNENDCVKAFSLMDLELAIDSIVKKPSSKNTIVNAVKESYFDSVKISEVELHSEKGHQMKTSLEVSFINNLDVTIDGLGHLAAELAVNDQEIVGAVFSGLNLNPGSNKMRLNADLQFVSSHDSQVQLATLLNDVLHNDPTTLTQIIGGTGLQIGVSSQDYIRALRKVKVGLKASKVLKKPDTGSDVGVDAGKILENLIIHKNDVDLSLPGAIKIDLDISVSNFTAPVAANIGYIGLSTQLEEVDLARVNVNDLSVSHTEDTLGLRCVFVIEIPGGDDIKVKVAQTAQKILNNGIHNSTVSAKVYNFGFGALSTDLIDSLALVSADFNPLSYISTDDASAGSKLNGSATVDIIYADVLDSRRLSAEIHGSLTGFPPIGINIPFFEVSAHMDGEELLDVSVNDILVRNGSLSMNSILYTHKNLNAAQKLAYIVGDILFHRPQSVPNKMNVLSVRFGASKESAIDIFEYISLDSPMKDMLEPINKIQESPETWIELWEMKSKISRTGLDASVVGKPFPSILPFAAKNKEAGATAKIGFGTNGTQTVVNLFFKDLFFTPGKPFTGKADIEVLVPEILPFLQMNVPHLFEWKNYDQNVSVGWPVMTIGDPHKPSISFDPFDQIFMDAPPLFLWTPLTFVPKLVNPFKNGLGIDVDIHVPNPGPLFADFGFLTTRMYHKGKEVAVVTNSRAVVIKNKLNGGELFGTNVIPLQVRIHLSKNPFKAWEELSDMIHNFKDYTVDIEASTPELGRVEWLSTCFNHVPEYMTGQMVPMLISMLAHIKLKVGPWTITPPERFRRGSQAMLAKLDPEHIKFVGSEVEVDSDHFMAQGHVSSFSGVNNAAEFDDWLKNAEADGQVNVTNSTQDVNSLNSTLVDPVSS